MQQVSDVPIGATGCDEAPNRGFVAMILERSGREPCGIGGGAPLLVGVLLALPGIEGRLSRSPKPVFRMLFRCDADALGGSLRAGRAGLDSSVSLPPFDCACRPEGRRGGNCGPGGSFPSACGREGRVGVEDPLGRESRLGRDGKLKREEEEEEEEEGAGAFPRMELNLAVRPPDKPPRVEDDLDSERGDGVKSISSFGRFGGSTGSAVSPHAGALILPFAVPVEFTEVVEAPRTLVAVVFAVECDASEVTDSREGRRCWSVGLRGGKLGRDSVYDGGGSARDGGGGGGALSLFVGTGGGTLGLGFSSGRGDGIGGGGARAGRDVRSSAGWLPMGAVSKTEPVTW